jgi:hypothetical protein
MRAPFAEPLVGSHAVDEAVRLTSALPELTFSQSLPMLPAALLLADSYNRHRSDESQQMDGAFPERPHCHVGREGHHYRNAGRMVAAAAAAMLVRSEDRHGFLCQSRLAQLQDSPKSLTQKQQRQQKQQKLQRRASRGPQRALHELKGLCAHRGPQTAPQQSARSARVR